MDKESLKSPCGFHIDVYFRDYAINCPSKRNLRYIKQCIRDFLQNWSVLRSWDAGWRLPVNKAYSATNLSGDIAITPAPGEFH